VEVQIDKEKIVERKMDSKGRISLREFAEAEDIVELAVLEVKRVETDD